MTRAALSGFTAGTLVGVASLAPTFLGLTRYEWAWLIRH